MTSRGGSPCVALLVASLLVFGCGRRAPKEDAPAPPPSSAAAATVAVKGLTLTERAARTVKEIARAEGLPSRVRVRVIGSDAGLFLYDLLYESETTPLDEIFSSRGVDLVVDPLSLQYLDGTVIDFVQHAAGSGFKFDNPNARPTL